MAIIIFTVIKLPRYEWDDEVGKNIMKFYKKNIVTAEYVAYLQ